MERETMEILEQVLEKQEMLLKNQESIFERLHKLETALETPQKQVSSVRPKPVIEKPKPQASEPITPAPQPNKETPLNLADTISSKPFKTRNHVKQLSSVNEDLEFKIGGTWLNRLGAVAVILGLSFFLKYSFDNQWIGPTGRIVMGILTGLGLSILGEKLRTKYSLYSQGLVGAGSLALYLSVYAAYNFYHLVKPSWAFAFLIIIMANTVLTSVRHDSYTIGVLGIIGGYAAPLLISTGNPLPWVFFGYLAILTTGIIGVSIYKRWDSFRLISFVVNQGLIALWFFTIYNHTHIVPSFVFISFNFLSYLIIATGYNIKIKSIINPAETSIVALNALSFFIWSKLLLEDTFFQDYMGFYALAIALLYVFIGRAAYKIHKDDKQQVYTLFAVSVKLLTIAIFLQLDYKYVAYGWILEAFGIFFIASQLKNQLMLFAGLIIIALGTVALPFWVNSDYIAVSWLGEALGLFIMGAKINYLEVRYSSIAALGLGSLLAFNNGLSWNLLGLQKFFINWPTAVMAIAIIMAVLIYFLYQNVVTEIEKHIRLGIGIGSLVMIFLFLSVENSHFFILHKFNFFLSPEQLSLSILWILYAVTLFVAGLKRNIKGFRYAALGLVGLIVLKAFFVDLSELAMIFKILLFTLLGVFLLGISFIYQKKRALFDRSDSM